MVTADPAVGQASGAVVMLTGMLRATCREGVPAVRAGQALADWEGEWGWYGTLVPDQAEPLVDASGRGTGRVRQANAGRRWPGGPLGVSDPIDYSITLARPVTPSSPVTRPAVVQEPSGPPA
jgi:hypothetical protein